MEKDLVKWAPFREVSRLRDEMDRLWEDIFRPQRILRPGGDEWIPAVDISDTADEVTVMVELPGMESKDISISLIGDVLIIRGEKKAEKERQGETFLLTERSYGSFVRSLRLPAEVEADKIEAIYKQGVLTIICPKKDQVKPRIIKIKAE
jgi:HSP20 family protein